VDGSTAGTHSLQTFLVADYNGVNYPDGVAPNAPAKFADIWVNVRDWSSTYSLPTTNVAMFFSVYGTAGIVNYEAIGTLTGGMTGGGTTTTNAGTVNLSLTWTELEAFKPNDPSIASTWNVSNLITSTSTAVIDGDKTDGATALVLNGNKNGAFVALDLTQTYTGTFHKDSQAALTPFVEGQINYIETPEFGSCASLLTVLTGTGLFGGLLRRRNRK